MGEVAEIVEKAAGTDFRTRVDNRTIQVGVIGLGYVGLPLVIEFVRKRFRVVGFDIDAEKVQMLHHRKSYFNHIPSKTIDAIMLSGRFHATTDYTEIEQLDVIIICVPTPLNQYREPDLSFIVTTAEKAYPHLRKGQLVVLESTTYPGTTDEVLLPILERSGLVCGEDLFLAYSPEREDPGNKEYTTGRIPKVLGGHTKECLERAQYLYGEIVLETVPVSSTRVAEAVKITENIFRCVNIALVNELKIIYTRMGIDIWEVIQAAESKPFGYMAFYPGPGLGGHCIPIDPFYLTWKSREYGCPTRFIELAGEINTYMSEYVVQSLMDALNERGKPIKNSSILLIGISYKKDIDDMRESPSLKLMTLLMKKGARVNYHDPYVPCVKRTREYRQLQGMESVPLTEETIASHDAVLISTAHSNVDYQFLVDHAQLVVDTRNATRNVISADHKVVMS